jgi:transposase InsO family protein
VKALGIKQVLSAPRSPWQRAYVERLIGSIRRKCLDHVIVFGERSLHRTLTAYCAYYHRRRTHLSLGQTRTAVPKNTASSRGYGGRASRGGRSASSLRTPRCLTRTRRHASCRIECP